MIFLGHNYDQMSDYGNNASKLTSKGEKLQMNAGKRGKFRQKVTSIKKTLQTIFDKISEDSVSIEGTDLAILTLF
jgi:hypothetical protein